MRPKALVERLPESAMNEDDQALWPAFRSKEIEAVSCALAIWDVERRAAAVLECVAIGLRGLHPRGRPAFAARNVRSIRIGIVPVGNLMKNHAFRFPFDSVGRADPIDARRQPVYTGKRPSRR